MEEYPETEDNQNENRNGQVLEKLTPDQLKTFENYIPVFGKELCQKIASKQWTFREVNNTLLYIPYY